MSKRYKAKNSFLTSLSLVQGTVVEVSLAPHDHRVALLAGPLVQHLAVRLLAGLVLRRYHGVTVHPVS